MSTQPWANAFGLNASADTRVTTATIKLRIARPASGGLFEEARIRGASVPFNTAKPLPEAGTSHYATH
jgi:hypothetical protein